MKTLIFHLFAAALLTAGSATAQSSFDSLVTSADSALKQFATDGTCQQENKDAASTVGKALEGIQYVAQKPNTNADYYIYLYSASWCPPCRKLMPSIVEEYPAIQKSGKVELILLGADRNMDAVKAYVEKYKAQFPATWQGDSAVIKLPGNQPPRGIPGAIIVNKEGKIVASGYGSIVLEWRKHTIDK